MTQYTLLRRRQVYTSLALPHMHGETSQTWLISSGCYRLLAALVLGHPTLELRPEVTDEALSGGSSSERSGTSTATIVAFANNCCALLMWFAQESMRTAVGSKDMHATCSTARTR